MSANPFGAPKIFGTSSSGVSFLDNTTCASPTMSTPSSTASIFGSKPPSVSFGSVQTPVFGQVSSGMISAGSGFGTVTSNSVFGNTGFGTSTQASSTFGNPAFGSVQQNTGFGNTHSSSVFGNTSQSSTGFGNTSSSGVLSTNMPSTAANIFSSNVASGSSSVFGTTGGASSGTGNVFGSNTTSSTTNVFGSIVPSCSSGGFGSVPPSSTTNIFGSSASTVTPSAFGTSAPVFGTTTGPGTAFTSAGSNQLFGTGGSSMSSTVSSQGTFGGKNQPASGSTVFGGQHTIFGSNSSGFGTGSVFGSVTKTTTIPTTVAPVTFNFRMPSADNTNTTTVRAGGIFSQSKETFNSGGETKSIFLTGSSAEATGMTAVQESDRTQLSHPERTERTKAEDASSDEESRPPSRGEASRKQLFKSEDMPTDGSSGSLADMQRRKRVIRREVKGAAPGGTLFGKALAGVAGVGKTELSHVASKLHTGRKEESDENTSKVAETRSSMARRVSSSGLLSRRTSVTTDDITTKMAIVCKNVDSKMNNNIILRKHFSRFGKVKKVFPQPRTHSATIHFEDHESAANAKKKGRYVRDSAEPLNIYWSTYTAKSPPEKKSEKASELDDELQSMMGPSDVWNDELSGLARPGGEKKKTSNQSGKQSTAAAAKVKKREVTTTLSKSRREVPTALFKSKREVPTTLSKSKELKARDSSPAPQESGISVMSLKSLSNMKAKTTSERYEILENRDKIMRMGRKKHADLATAKVFVGTCPDMCTEKERWVREDRRRLSKYEIIPGTDLPGENPKVDHARAVKEYSRSSADQDEPLPHELRPSPVLDMTMNYLMHHILDRGGEGEWEEWFEFLWSRTRGIRKDITQQMLCDITATELTEKCARFHIFCSERLCEEPMQVFDAKINDENLTKCLQSLKEMYADLAKSKNICAPNEAEFRAYMVLMNLNEGDTLREAQQLRDEVRSSPEINFVLSVYSALNFNNYVRFFKLVKKAPFLYACIMHRYFTQVRRQALLTIMKAFGGPHNKQYPVSELVRQLAFEDVQEAAEFCMHHGLTVQEDGQVVLDRSAFIEPEVAFAGRRAVNVIESKQTVSVGEVVNGRPLPPFDLHIPASSFTEDGTFKAEDISSGNYQQNKPHEHLTTTQMPSVASATVLPSEEKTQQTAHGYSNEAVKEVAKEMFLEIISEMCLDISKNVESAIGMYLSFNGVVLDTIIDDLNKQEIRCIYKELVLEQHQKEDEIRKLAAQKEAEAREAAKKEVAAREACKLQMSGELQQQLLDEVLTREIRNVATIEAREHQSAMKCDRIERCTEAVAGQYLRMFVDWVAETMASEMCSEIEKKFCDLEENERCVELLRTSRFFRRWQDKYAKQQRLKRAMLNFPVAPSVIGPKQQLHYLLPDSEGIQGHAVHLGKKARLSLESPPTRELNRQRILQTITLQNYVRQLQQKKAWAPFNLQKEVAQRLLPRQTQKLSISRDNKVGKIYWKLLLSVPDSEETTDLTDDAQTLIRWIDGKFRKGLVPISGKGGEKTSLLSLYTAPLDVSTAASLGVCVRKCSGVLSEEETQKAEENFVFLGSNGLIFFMLPYDESSEDEQCYWLSAQLRLAGLIQTIPIYPPVPILVAIATTAAWKPDVEEAIENLNLQSFVDQDCLSDFSVVCLGSDVNLPSPSTELLKGLHWLADCCPSQPQLEFQPIRHLLDDVLSNDFYTPLYQNLHQRRKAGFLHQAPDVIIGLYNSVIQHLSDVVSHEKLHKFSWPVPEFISSHSDLPQSDWNSREQLNLLRELMQSLMLPEFSYCSKEVEDFEKACDDVWHYVDLIVQDEQNKAPLYSRIRGLLRRCHEDFEDRCFLDLREWDCRPTYVNLPWTEILTACIAHQLSMLDLHTSQQLEDEGENEIMVCYLREDLEGFRQPPIWREASREKNEQESTTLDASVVHAGKRKKEETFSRVSPKQPKLDTSRGFIDLATENPVYMDAKDTANDLASFMSMEKKKSLQFEEYLQKSLNSGITFSESFPEQNQDITAISSPISLQLYPDGTSVLANQSYDTQTTLSPSGGVRRHSLSDSLQLLQNELEASKAASRIHDLRLQQLLAKQ